jgi:orotidine-5'-phosphate decarboxylase
VRAPFGERLDAAVAVRGPLCVGIDPAPGLLADWALRDDARGLETFALAVVDALADRAAVLKPQVAFFERHGSRGVAVLERVLAEASTAGVLTLADAKRGDIGSTMAAYADAFLGEGSRSPPTRARCRPTSASAPSRRCSRGPVPPAAARSCSR